MSRMQAVNMGWDLARPGGDKTVYYCSRHGHMDTPCACIDGYFKSQVKETEARRQRKFAEGDRLLTTEFQKQLEEVRRGRQ